MFVNKFITKLTVPLPVKVMFLYLLLFLPFTLAGVINTPSQVYAKNETTRQQGGNIAVANKKPEARVVAGAPTTVTIKKLGIHLQVLPGTYNYSSRTWSLDHDNLFFITKSTEPNNQSGISIIYGHNTQKILGKTNSLDPGDEVILKVATGEQLAYRFTHMRLVEPDDDAILKEQSTKPKLVLLSCHGLFDEQRRLMYFDFVEMRHSNDKGEARNG